jgi:hypothetical protein
VGRRGVPSDLVRNIELLVGVALPLFLTGVWLQDHLTGSGHWAHPLESAFFEWLSLVPLLAFVGLLHSVGMAMVAALWPRAAHRGTVVLGAVLMVPLLVLAGRPLRCSPTTPCRSPWRSPSTRSPAASPAPRAAVEDLRTAPLREEELLGHARPRGWCPPRGAAAEPASPARAPPARRADRRGQVSGSASGNDLPA